MYYGLNFNDIVCPGKNENQGNYHIPRLMRFKGLRPSSREDRNFKGLNPVRAQRQFFILIFNGRQHCDWSAQSRAEPNPNMKGKRSFVPRI